MVSNRLMIDGLQKTKDRIRTACFWRKTTLKNEKYGKKDS